MWWRVIDNFRGRRANKKYELQLSRAERATFRRLVKLNPPEDAYSVILQWRGTEEEARRRSEMEAVLKANLHRGPAEQSPPPPPASSSSDVKQ